VRRAAALVLVFSDDGPVIWNFLLKHSFVCSPASLDVLSSASRWLPLSALADTLPGVRGSSVARELQRLIELGALVVAGTELAGQDEEYQERWEWGVTAGLYHFSVRNERFADDVETRMVLAERTARVTSPKLTAEVGTDHIPLERVSTPLLELMWSRRSRRLFAELPVTLRQLACCLFSGLGVTGTVEQPLLGPMPLTMTPSGGARNPYEAYVYAQRVDGLARGIYHYAAREHALTPVPQADEPPPASYLLSGQHWADSAAAVVFLVANYERTMWKYGHPNAYKVVQIEAGHIVQNMLLTATYEGLAGTPTAALQEDAIEQVLGEQDLCHSAVYAVVLGTPQLAGKLRL
jgi:SagB-type dehydrogenase family enzyme